MISSLPLPLRNRLAALILAALHDAAARRQLAALAASPDSVLREDWLAGDDQRYADLLYRRARGASEAIEKLPLRTEPMPVAEALEDAAALFDTGLYFEVHERLEPYWLRAVGAERQALQGLIQIAVGYQHAANGNVHGARALFEEGSARLREGALAALDLEPFVRAVQEALTRLPDPFPAPAFPRRTREKEERWTSS